MTSAFKSVLVASLLFAGMTGVAIAREPVFTVKLAAPVSEQTRVIAQDTIWSCEGDTCVARPSHASTVRACRQFVREAGVAVTAYGSEAQQLSADEIARCNGDAPLTQQARN